ncbi:MAG: hypothetical protein RI897_3012 [Verrucomicrobiota bacterium]
MDGEADGACGDWREGFVVEVVIYGFTQGGIALGERLFAGEVTVVFEGVLRFGEGLFERSKFGGFSGGEFFTEGAVSVLDTGENRLESVVILLRDGIELVVVAAGAAEGEAKKGCARGVDHVIQLVLALREREVRVGTFDDVVGAGDEESGCGVDAVGIAGELFTDELIVGLVVIE